MKRLGAIATVSVWTIACLSVLAQTQAAAGSREGRSPLDSRPLASRQTPAGRAGALAPPLTARAADIDADGDLDLVSAGKGGIRTWVNTGHGRFVEQSAARTLLRKRTPHGFKASHCAAQQSQAAVSTERDALTPGSHRLPTPGARLSRRRPSGLPFASRAPTKGGSRAPPAPAA